MENFKSWCVIWLLRWKWDRKYRGSSIIINSKNRDWKKSPDSSIIRNSSIYWDTISAKKIPVFPGIPNNRGNWIFLVKCKCQFRGMPRISWFLTMYYSQYRELFDHFEHYSIIWNLHYWDINYQETFFGRDHPYNNEGPTVVGLVWIENYMIRGGLTQKKKLITRMTL